jgi:formylglycine-generating enzyme required for sulfatase activity
MALRLVPLLCLILPAFGGPPDDAILRALVRVEVEKQQGPGDTGAGIVISASPDSVRIVTATHVIEKAKAWWVYFYSDKSVRYPATVLGRSSDPNELDLAVLEVLRPANRPLPTGIPALAVRDRGTLARGESVWSVDREWDVVPNTVVALFDGVDPQHFRYTRGSTDDGFSGGAVFDDAGKLIGIHHGGKAGGTYAVAVKVESAVETLNGPLGYNTPNLAVGNTASVRDNPPPAKPAASTLRAGSTRVNPKDGLTYVWIPPGTFRMGCSVGDNECPDNERPAHDVTITKGFWIGQTEVTQEAYRRIIKDQNPSNHKGPTFPVDDIRWNQALAYCQAAGLRLPTEAEWEYAARAGDQRSRYGDIDAIAWYRGNSGNETHGVAQKSPNAWGLYDTLGNVTEWTADWYGDKFPIATTDPSGPTSGLYRVIRGNYWGRDSQEIRVSQRSAAGPDDLRGSGGIGVRCVGELP